MPPQTVGSVARPSTLGAAPDSVAQVQFRVEVPGLVIGRFAECSGLAVEWDVLPYAEGGNNAYVHGLRGRMRYRNVVLSRGVTSEDALLKWFFEVQQASRRPTLTVAVLNPLGQDARRFSFAAAFPVRWTGPELHVGSAAGSNETLEIGHEGLVG